MLEGFEGEELVSNEMIHELEMFYLLHENELDDELKFKLACAYVNLAKKFFHFIEKKSTGEIANLAKNFGNMMIMPEVGDINFQKLVVSYTSKQSTLQRAQAA